MDSILCLVTGAAGFIGSHLAERLIRDGYRVVGVDCFADYYDRQAKQGNLANLWNTERFVFVEADLVDLNLMALLRGEIAGVKEPSLPQGNGRPLGDGRAVEIIFHLAGQPGVRASWGRSFDVYTRNNVLATQRLLEAARDVSLRKFVYASSSSVYGDAETFPTTEDVTPHPVSPYGVTKLAGEHLCLLYFRNYGTPVACLRYFTVYGPRQRPDMAFCRFIKAMLEGSEITVYGDGEQTRDFTFVDDAVEGTVRAGLSEVTGEVFNIGGGSRVTVNAVLDLLEKESGRQVIRRYAKAEKGDVKDTSADIRKAGGRLGYRPSVSLAEGLSRQLRWLPMGGQEPTVELGENPASPALHAF